MDELRDLNVTSVNESNPIPLRILAHSDDPQGKKQKLDEACIQDIKEMDLPGHWRFLGQGNSKCNALWPPCPGPGVLGVFILSKEQALVLEESWAVELGRSRVLHMGSWTWVLDMSLGVKSGGELRNRGFPQPDFAILTDLAVSLESFHEVYYRQEKCICSCGAMKEGLKWTMVLSRTVTLHGSNAV